MRPTALHRTVYVRRELLELGQDQLLLSRRQGIWTWFLRELIDEDIDGIKNTAQLVPVAPHLSKNRLLNVGIAGVVVYGDEMLKPGRIWAKVQVTQKLGQGPVRPDSATSASSSRHRS